MNFEHTPDVAEVLKRCPGFQDSGPVSEALHTEKPVAGCVDAPKCFFLTEIGAKPTTHGPKLAARRVRGRRGFAGTIHVDDVKTACSPETLKELTACLEEAAGAVELDVAPGSFTNCGFRHTKLPTGYALDRAAYLAALKPIAGAEPTAFHNDNEAPPPLAKLFLSPLMELAFTLLTRAGLWIYVTALQRSAQRPTGQHARRLNTLVRRAQRSPYRITYHQLKCVKHLLAPSDSAFRKEVAVGSTAGRARRGHNTIRVGEVVRSGSHGAGTTRRCHLIDWRSSALKVVMRSTFASETQSAVMTADALLCVALTLHEL